MAHQLHLWLILLVIVGASCCCSSTSSYSNSTAPGTATIPSSHSLKVDLASAHRSGAVRDQLVSSSSYRTSIFAGSGQFISSLSIGTPPVSFTAIVDTGSDLVWRQCMPCKQCYPQADGGATIFDPSKSSTYTKASCKDPLCSQADSSFGGRTCAGTCKYTSFYDDPPAYTRGDLSYDTLTILSVSGELRRFPRFAFGCSHESHGPYNFAGSGGIIGLGQGPLSLRAQLNVHKFSYCLRSITDTSPSPLFLGPEASLLGGAHDVQSTPILYNDTTVYNVQLKGISVGGKKLSISPRIFNEGGAIVDSGTTFTTLAPPAFNAVLKAFRSRISLPRAHGSSPRNLTLCYESSGPVPSLAFHFHGANLYLPSHNYFITIQGLFCLAILESSDNHSVFGNVQQQNYHILYDLEARLISFKPTACHALLK